MTEVVKTDDQIIDEAESILAQLPPVDLPLIHRFTPGLYIREIFMPAGTMVTSKIHKTEHPFIISKGKVAVYNNGKVVMLEAPYCGITKPGTRRVLYCHTDVIWTTIHRNDDNCTDPLVIEDRIIEKHDNPLLSEEIKIKNHLN